MGVGCGQRRVCVGSGRGAGVGGASRGAVAAGGRRLLGGAGARLGVWRGGGAGSPHWAAVALAVGAGSILQVMVEVAAYLTRRGGGKVSMLTSPTVVGGTAAGIVVMYATGIFVKI